MGSRFAADRFRSWHRRTLPQRRHLAESSIPLSQHDRRFSGTNKGGIRSAVRGEREAEGHGR